jgi:hypothetical protein
MVLLDKTTMFKRGIDFVAGVMEKVMDYEEGIKGRIKLVR